MSLIEKFFIMFESDAGQLASDIDGVEKKTKDFALAAQNAAKVDFKNIKETPSAADQIINAMENLVGTLEIAIGKGGDLNKAFEETKKSADGVAKSTKKIGDEAGNSSEKINSFKKSFELLKAKFEELGGSLKGALKGIVAPLVAVFTVASIVSSGLSRIEEISGLGKISEKSRIAVGDLDALGKSAKLLGGDINSANQDISNLAEKSLEAASNKASDAAKDFKSLGISLKNQKGELKDTNTLLLDLAGAADKYSKTQVQDKLKKMGFTDEGMVKLIMSGKKAVLEHIDAQKKSGVATEEQVEQARKYKQAQAEFGQATSQASADIMVMLLPALTYGVKGLKEFVNWCKQNKTFIASFFGVIAGVVTYLYLPAMLSAASATLAATWPILVIVAILAALALVLDDVINYMQGNDSILGRLAAKYEWVQGIINAVKSTFSAFAEVAKEVWAALKSLFNGDFSGFATHIKNIFNTVTGFWKNMWRGFLGIADTIIVTIAKKLLDMLPGWARKLLGLSDKKIQQMKDSLDRAKEEKDRQRAKEFEESDRKEEERRKATELQRGTEDIQYEEAKRDAPEQSQQNIEDMNDDNDPLDLSTLERRLNDADREAQNKQIQNTINLGKNSIQQTSQTPIPANPAKPVEVKKETHVNVTAPITINNTVDTQAAVEAAAKAAQGVLTREMNKAVSNTDNGVVR